MKQTTITILLTALVIAGCSKSSSTKSNSSSSNNNSTACLYDYYTNPVCPGYAQTTGGTTSGSTTGSTGGGNYTGMPDSNNNWASRYNTTGKPTVPSVNCSQPVNQPNGPNYAPRKGTVHMSFRKNYRPDISGLPSFSNSISYFLTSVNTAKSFLDSDGHLKVRFMPRPQRVPSSGDKWCYDRTLGSGSGTAYGYTELTYSVGVYGIQNGALVGPVKTDYLTTGIQTCSPALDYSGQAQQFPEGIVLTIFDVYSNQGCSTHPCSALSQVSTTCWGMDIEVATDSTKTF